MNGEFKMKLNYKRTFFVGFAFFLICAFWQAYDNTIPLILTNKFGMSQTFSGVIMAADNILALFMLPLFGSISDKCRSRMGRRTPFVLFGTIVAAAALLGIGLADSLQVRNLGIVTRVDDPAALQEIYEKETNATLMTPNGETFVLSEQISADEFSALTTADAQYTQIVVPARQAYAANIRTQNMGTLLMFVIMLAVALLAMSTFRSPAVALMPDVTPKPLRSRANAVICLMGAVGGIIVLILGIVFGTGKATHSMMEYIGFFGAIAAVMLVSLLIFMLTVREPQWAKEAGGEILTASQAEEELDGVGEEIAGKILSDREKKSLMLLLASIVFWFMGYNAVTSKYSVYASNILDRNYNLTLMIAQAAAILSYIPVGAAAARFGRKKCIIAGVVMLGTAFLVAAFIDAQSPALVMNIMFALAGIGWATISVNSFPMVVELCSGADTGKYTGIYYTASMAAQTVTPILSGFFMDRMGMRILFPYAVICVGLAFITMLFVLDNGSEGTKTE